MSAELELIPSPLEWFADIAAGRVVVSSELTIAEGALPPIHVARRVLGLLADGCPKLWAVPFNIVLVAERLVVGGCGFKGLPVAGVVEIGYGIAEAYHRRGFAQFAVREMLQLAQDASIVSEIEARIAPDNVASASLVRRAGFICGARIVDADGAQVDVWRWAVRRLL